VTLLLDVRRRRDAVVAVAVADVEVGRHDDDAVAGRQTLLV